MTKKRKKKSKINIIINTVLIFFVVALTSAIIFLSVFTLCPVSGASMLPSIENAQRVLLVRTQNAKIGDTIVFKSSEKMGGNNLIKRVIATGGDKLLFVSSVQNAFDTDERIVLLYRDSGSGFYLVNEDYILEDMRHDKTSESEFCRIFEYEKPAELFKEGKLNIQDESEENNDGASVESGAYQDGENQDESYQDYVITIKAKHYYVMGDNRNVSRDSRHPLVGFVNQDSVIGRKALLLKRDSFLEKFLMLLYRDKAEDRKQLLTNRF